jgi:Arc/MetJ-type ribon-helix-helix transcriptional regulator
MAKIGQITLSVRIPPRLKKLIKKYVQNKGFHANVSEFTRDAVREKLARDAPELYRQLIGDAIE